MTFKDCNYHSFLGFLEEEKCDYWPVEKCSVTPTEVKKYTPETSCEKVPREMCAPAGCGLTEVHRYQELLYLSTYSH